MILSFSKRISEIKNKNEFCRFHLHHRKCEMWMDCFFPPYKHEMYLLSFQAKEVSLNS